MFGGYTGRLEDERRVREPLPPVAERPRADAGELEIRPRERERLRSSIGLTNDEVERR